MNATVTAAMAPSGSQCMRALERANQVRLARAALKRRVAIGEIEAADVILDSPWEAQSMAVADLLMSQRRWGQTRCRKLVAEVLASQRNWGNARCRRFLTAVRLSERKTIGSMTERQRRVLARGLGPTPVTAPLTRQGPALGGHGGGGSCALQSLAVLDRPGKALKELH
jgi:hypothetical protein